MSSDARRRHPFSLSPKTSDPPQTAGSSLVGGSDGEKIVDITQPKNSQNQTNIKNEDGDGKKGKENDDTADELEKHEFQEDVFSIIFVSKVMSVAFLYSIAIYFIQMVILVMCLLNLLNNAKEDNPLSIPAFVEDEVVAAQICAIVVSVITSRDFITGLDFLMPYDNKICDIFPYAYRWKWFLTSFMRLSEGALGILVAFVFVLQSDNVLDLFLDFAVVQFVSELDNVGFYIADKGLSLFSLHKVTKEIKENHMMRKRKIGVGRCRVDHTIFKQVLFFALLITSMSSWVQFRRLQVKGVFFNSECQIFELKFPPLTYDYFQRQCQDPERIDYFNCSRSWLNITEPLVYSSFSDTYEAQKEDDQFYLVHHRPVYIQRNRLSFGDGDESPPGKIFYCHQVGAWVFTIEGVRKGSSADDCSWLMKSPETTSLHFNDVPEEDWTVWTNSFSNSLEEASVDHFCAECEDIGGESEYSSTCSFNGKCSDEKCICKAGVWMGNQCETCAACKSFTLEFPEDETMKDVLPVRMERFAKNDEGEPAELYGRPVFYHTDVLAEKTTFVLYSGSHYIFFSFDHSQNGGISESDDANFELIESFHSTWDLNQRKSIKTLAISEATYSTIPSEPGNLANVLRWKTFFNKTEGTDFELELNCENKFVEECRDVRKEN